jgi:hypothetical protein
MSQALMDYVCALREVEVAAAALHLAELHLSDDDSAAVAVNKAQGDLARAARKLTLAVDELPLSRQPIGWNEVAR